METHDQEKTMLIDITKCMGCRGCQVACKQWNELPADQTTFFGGAGYQNPPSLNASTYTRIRFNEIPVTGGDVKFSFCAEGCMHCLDPACVAACPLGAIKKREDGAVTYDKTICFGCRFCMMACPFDIPKFEWKQLFSFIRKCTFCSEGKYDRITTHGLPACVKTCPTGALSFGARKDMLEEAKRRIKQAPGKYINYIYGEKEAGGTSRIYISGVPFDKLGFNMKIPKKPIAADAASMLKTAPILALGLIGATAGIYWFTSRKNQVKEEEGKKNVAKKI